MTGLLPRRVLPVLMYHRVGQAAAGDPALWVGRSELERHLRWIAERGVRTLTLDEAFAAWRRRPCPPRSVVLTFDDAFADALEAAGPALAAAGATAAVFAPAGLLGRPARLRPAPGAGTEGTQGVIAGAGELGAWVAAGHGVGSHGLTHSDLTALPAEQVREELERSRRLLEEVLARPVLDLCYPYARHDAAARAAAAASGYRMAYAGEPPRDDLYAVPRMMIYPGEPESRFARKLSGYYYWLSSWYRRLGGRRREAKA